MIVGRRLLRIDEVPSSNDLVKRMAKEGEPEGLVVVASRQTAGRGRMGRSWSSPEGGLYVSILLRPRAPAKQLLRMSVFSGVPAAKAIEAASGLKIGLKWPNDLQVGGHKVGGMLMEAATVGSRTEFVVLGMGINVNSTPESIGVEGATSLSAAAGKEIDRERLLDALLAEFDRFYADFAAGKIPDDEYAARSTVLKRRVEAAIGNQRFAGKALYINEDGALVLKSDEGLVLQLSWVNETSLRLLDEPADFASGEHAPLKKDLISN